MNNPQKIRLTGKGGWQGELLDPESTPGYENLRTVVLTGGERLQVPADLLVRQSDGSYYLPLDRSELERLESVRSYAAGEDVIIPVLREDLDVQRQRVETGRIRVHKRVNEYEKVVDEPLLRDQVEVERVRVDQEIERPPDVRYEGDTMIIPVLEEVLVVEKRLVLREELRITRRTVESRNPQQVVLRSEDVQVERVESPR